MRQRRGRRRAQALMEFAIVIPVFMLLVFAMIDFARLLFTYVSLTNGDREIARTVTTTSSSMASISSTFNNLTIIGGPVQSATNVSLTGDSGSIGCTSTNDAMCTVQVTTGPSQTPSCPTGLVCLTNVAGASGSASYSASGFHYAFSPNGNGDFLMLTWLSPDQYGRQQGYVQLCRLPFTNNCVFPSGLDRTQNTNGFIQVDLRYTFQFNPLFQTRLDGVIDVSFMRPSTLLTTSVRTYAE